MMYHLSHPSKTFDAEITLPYSKSISNRLLIIQALCKNSFEISNLSNAHDTKVLAETLAQNTPSIDVKDCGTAFRFLTAYLATREGEFILTGSKQMKRRPIKYLVDALKQLGAEIHYLEKKGFPPLKISGKPLAGGRVDINASISSQFISALLLIAPTLNQGLELNLQGKILSKPYIMMTIECMRHFDVDVKWTKNIIHVLPQTYRSKNIKVEADWSSLAFFLQAMAFSKQSSLKISGLFENSWQGDAKMLEVYSRFGIKSQFINGYLYLSKKDSISETDNYNINLIDLPDVAPAYCCTLAGINKTAVVSGLDNLKHKESHRLMVLHEELNKMKQNSRYTNSMFSLLPSTLSRSVLPFESHNDHRICMSLAPFGLLFDVEINGVETVQKSFPNFWQEMKKIGFTINQTTG